MPRPRCHCRIRHCPKTRVFKPVGIPTGDLDVVQLLPEEAEALRLKDINDLSQTDAAEKMGISQSSFQRILSSARKKISSALLESKAIKIGE